MECLFGLLGRKAGTLKPGDAYETRNARGCRRRDICGPRFGPPFLRDVRCHQDHFDATKTTELQGTVKEFQWTDPHAWIMLTVLKDGQPQEWAIEMNGPGGLARQGWRPKTLTPGVPVKMMIHPLKDGTNGGQFMEITLPDGNVMPPREGRNAAPPAPAQN
jgi:Family of unknown function (DUF6152)